ncbi:MAG: KEOPS complex kinase/ATPase Bud32 [Candidatus Aenigmatarchaeota archaeon]
MEFVARGAEAVLCAGVVDGRKVLVKERVRKSYRLPQIDERLRRERTNHEVKLLTDARAAGVPTPQVLDVDKTNNKIVMEFVEGERVKEFLGHATPAQMEKACQRIGRSVGRLHTRNITHGDLTTSNMIIHRASGKVYFIDFGLGGYSNRVEEKAVDLKLLRDALRAAHYNILKRCWRIIVEGYKKEYKDAEEVIKQIDVIEGRMRYAERVANPEGKGQV